MSNSPILNTPVKVGDAVQQGNFRSATRSALEIAYRI